MNQERDLDRTHIAPSAPTHDDDLAPGRNSSSSHFDAPTEPVASGLIQRVAKGSGRDPAIDGSLEAATHSPSTGLPSELQGRLEGSLGTDLSSVRVHTGPESAQAASKLGAHAYALGQDVHFGAGTYQPDSPDGQSLIAHEVVHTVQQRGASPAVQGKLEVSAPDDAHEVEAEHFAQSFVSGGSHAPVSRVGGGVSGLMIARSGPITANPTTIKSFFPDVRVTPPTAKGALGHELVETASVTNALHADAGTTFQWAWTGLDPTKLAAGVLPEAGATAPLRVTPKSVGTHDATPEVTVTAKDGLQKKQAPAVHVNVAKPTAQWLVSIEAGNTAPNTAGMKSDPIKVYRNDTIVASALVDTDDLAVAGIHAESVTAGRNLAGTAAITKNKAQWRIKLDHPGLQSFDLGLAVPGMTEELSHTVNVQVVMTLDDVFKKCTAAIPAVSEKWHAMSATLKSAATAFEDAKKKHEQTLSDGAAAGRLAGDLIVGAFFAGVAGAAGGAVGNQIRLSLGEAVTKSTAGGACTDAGKDLTKFAVKSLEKLTKGAPAGAQAKPTEGGPADSAAGGGAEGVGQDPVRWARNLAITLDQEAARLNAVLKKVINAVADSDATTEVATDIDPVAVIEESAFAKEMEKVSTKESDYAIGLWETWIRNFGYSVAHSVQGDKNSGNVKAYASDNTADLLGKIRRGIAAQCGAAEADRLLNQVLPQVKERAEADAKQENKI